MQFTVLAELGEKVMLHMIITLLNLFKIKNHFSYNLDKLEAKKVKHGAISKV